jgi:hypothetical protein
MLECQHISLLVDKAGFKNFDPTLTTNAGNAYPIPIQPNYHIQMPQSSLTIIFRPGIWYLLLAFSAIGGTWCKPYGLKDPFDQEFIQTTDSINCVLVIFNFSPSLGCKQRSQCSSESSSSLSLHSLQSSQTHCPSRLPLVIPNAIMIVARYATPSMAPTKTIASKSMSYLMRN